MPAGPASRHWRRYLRFSVRGLLVVVLAMGAWMGWLVRSARIQREAVVATERAGGLVAYVAGWTDNSTFQNREQRALKWLIDAIGIDYFVPVVAVSFDGKCSDEGLAHIGRLSGLRRLDVSGWCLSDVGPENYERLIQLLVERVQSVRDLRVTDAGLVHLKGLTNLSELNLLGTQVTDAGLAHLSGLTNLSELNLSETHVTGAGLAHLTGLSNLWKLDLSDSSVTDAGLANLKGLPSVSWLSLYDTRVTDAGLENLKGLTNVSEIDLSFTSVTDAGLAHLQGLTKLSALDLRGTRVADGGLVHLMGLTKLSKLNVLGTQVTDAGVKELKRALPGLSIDY